MSSSSTRIIKIILLLLIVSGGILLYSQLALAFVPLFCLLILFLLYPLIKSKSRKSGNGYELIGGEEEFNTKGLEYTLMVMLFGFLSLVSLNNYIHPRQDIYKNIDHHAIRVDGLLLEHWQGYTLAANSRDAFFDNEIHQGRIVVEDTLNGGVVLGFYGFSEPVFTVSGKEMRHLKLVDSSAFVHFGDNDRVEFIKHTPRGELVNSLVITPGHVNYPSFKLWKHDVDTATYIFNGLHESIEHRYLKSGLPLSDLMAGVVPEFDPKGIIVFRNDIDYDVKSRDIDKYYSRQQYYIGYTSEADFSEIRVNGVPQQRISNYHVTIPFGKPFIIGFGTNKTETMCFGTHDGCISLEYYLPKYQYLAMNNDNKDQTLMVTTSLFDSDDETLLGAYSENIALFNVFSKADNVNQMQPWYLCYKSGHTDEAINFTAYSDSTHLNCKSMDVWAQENNENWESFNSHKSKSGSRFNSYFHGIRTLNGTSQWMVGVENFKNTTPFSARKMAMLLLLVIILSAISIRIGGMSNETGKDLITGAEYAAYLIIIAFLTIRCFLMWRVSVFPPVSSISFYEFNLLRDEAVYNALVISIMVFYGVVIVYKLYLMTFSRRIRIKKPVNYPGYTPTKKEKFYSAIRNKWVFVSFMVFAYVILLLVPGNGSWARIVNILVPILLFFIFEFFIFLYYGKSPQEDIEDSQNYNPIGERLWPVILSMINILLVSFLTFLKDGGYGVMFILFGLLIIVFLISELRIYTNNRESSKFVTFARFFLYIIVIAFGILYLRLFIWVLDHTLALSIGVFITLSLCLYLLSHVLEFRESFNKKKWGWPWVLSISLIAVISFWGVLEKAPKKINGSHLEYRTRVHMASPSDILSKTIDNSVSQNKFMQASLNDFVLREYSEIGRDVNPINKKGYFKIQPQSKLGAMWGAQTTDIALSRFIIAEHSHWLAVLLVVSLFFFFLIAIREPFSTRQFRFIQLAVPLLLFLQAGLIFFANTRLFVFFGQDFPLISVTSKLSSAYFFMLMTLFMISVLRERDAVIGGPNGPEMSEYDQSKILEYDVPTTAKIAIGAVVIILLPILSSAITHKTRSKDHLSEMTDGVYSLDTLMTSVRTVTDSLNTVFVSYQNRHPMTLKTDMSPEMSEFRNDTSSQYMNFMAYQERLDTNKFATRIIERFMTKGCHKNTAKGLIHLRTERTYDSDGHHHDVLKFGVNDGFYDYQLPQKQKFAWKGSIVGDGFVPDDRVTRETAGDVSIVKLRKEWLRDQSHDVALVRTEGTPIRVMGENSIIDLSRRRLPVVAVSGKDNILSGRRSISNNVVPRKNYFARNVTVNGTRTFLYPYGSKLFWVREFANQIKYSKESLFKRGNKLASKDEIEHFNDDVPITISETLSRTIYDLYSTVAKDSKNDRTVVVADGNGHIKAMVDYRGDKQFRLNPNNEKEISHKLDEIYLQGLRRSPTEQRYFSTFATSPLRRGPGSSQKPITWTAVSSGYSNRGLWSDLSIIMPSYDTRYVILNDKGQVTHYLFPNFAGQPIQKAFKSLSGDEGAVGLVPITLQWYMYKSSNYYNAMMAYFGLYTRDQLASLLPPVIPTSVQDVERAGMLVKRVTNQDPISVFPIMHNSSLQGYNRFAFARALNVSEYTNHDALLARGLEKNFNLPLKRSRSESLYPSVKLYSKKKGQSSFSARPSYRQASFFNMGIRERFINPEEMMEIGVRTVAIGNNTSWIVSPVKMAEMFGRLITLNKNYSLTLDPSTSNEYKLFDIDYGNSTAGVRDYQNERRNFIYGLSKVFKSNNQARTVSGSTTINRDGTAAVINEHFSQFDIAFDDENNSIGRYYVYGKTGTINAKWDGKDNDDHLLSVIITDTRISTTEDLRNVKFYVIYFADFEKTGWGIIDRSIVEAVLRSDEFRTYMNQSE